MKIITVNLPVSYLHAVDGLVGETALYPSRSELIRVAVREFIIKELTEAKVHSPFIKNPEVEGEPQGIKEAPQEPVDQNLIKIGDRSFRLSPRNLVK